jgi:quinone-modifying oxidoreductase subunit QmoC
VQETAEEPKGVEGGTATPESAVVEMDIAAPAYSKDGTPYRVEPDLAFIDELALFGAKTFKECYQCATCSGTCSISPDENPFPRKEMLWLKWGLKDRLIKDLDVWTCYYCGDCSTDCPREADPGETMMALRRYVTSVYDWTGISRLLYTSRLREIGAIILVGLVVVGLFYLSGAFTPERMITDHVSVDTFAPVHLVHYADWVMAGILSFFLLTNTFRMWRIVMDGQKVPLSAYVRNLKTFVVHAATQKKWRECKERNTRSHWLKHFLLVPAYVAMFILVMFFLDTLQVDGSEFTQVSYLGYAIAFILLYVSAAAIIGRLRKKEEIHKHSHDSDWMFLILLFLTSLTGILMHVLRIMDWPLSTYYMYVIHLAIAVPLLVLEVPFMKWAHLMYRPLALYLKEVKESATAMEMKA